MTGRTALPDLLGRDDVAAGRWVVEPCSPVRGQPRTSVVDRVMHIPGGDDDYERVVRAHEMMHARVTPGVDFPEWIARGQASERALRAAEEFRVNWLVGTAGFDVKKFLADGTEKEVGKRLAAADNWTEAVYFAAACAGTASMNPFLTGVRRHRREWANTLRAIERRLVRDAKKIGAYELGRTDPCLRTELSPAGFLHTEAWAVFLDGLALPPVEETDGPEGETSEAPVSPEQVKDRTVEVVRGRWPEVRVGNLPLTVGAPGGLGRTRRAADRGRAPRRIHRLLTDPQRRVFDQNRRGNGGVVLVDGSGSMRLTEADVRRILEAAPGATVAIYACSSGEEAENVWVLADRGRMTDQIPKRPAGNGVDAPAAQWALGRRQHASAPVVWITDGIVHYPQCGYTHRAALECVEVALAGNVVIRPDVDTALTALRDLTARRRPPQWWPKNWRHSWRALRGSELRSEVIF